MGPTRSFCQSPARAAGSLTVAILCLLLLPVAGSGHHSRAEFSEQVEEIQGEIVSFRWSNPHPMIMLRAVRDDAEEETLQIQVYGAANNLSQAGVTDELFEVGDRIMIVGRRSTLRPGLVLGTHMFLADGRQAILARTLEPYRPGEVVGGLDAFIENASTLADAASENRGFFRVWSIEPGRGGEGVTSNRPLTEAAKAAQAEFDQQDSWIGRGEAPGMPAFMNSRNHFEFIDQGDTIRYEQPVFGVIRTIHLNPEGNAEVQPHSPMGYSTGRLEGNTLVVETSRLNWPYLSRSGIPLSEDVRIVERFTLSDDQGRLDYHMTIIDPVNFTEPATYSRHWVALENPPPEERFTLD